MSSCILYKTINQSIKGKACLLTLDGYYNMIILILQKHNQIEKLNQFCEWRAIYFKTERVLTTNNFHTNQRLLARIYFVRSKSTHIVISLIITQPICQFIKGAIINFTVFNCLIGHMNIHWLILQEIGRNCSLLSKSATWDFLYLINKVLIRFFLWVSNE